MTRVTARYGRDGCGIESVGHAGTPESCAAVSAILWALAGWCQNNVGSFRMGRGAAHIAMPRIGGADAVMDLAVIGLMQVQKAAPDDVRVEIVNET